MFDTGTFEMDDETLRKIIAGAIRAEHERLYQIIKNMHTREEWLSGQYTKYVQLADVLDYIIIKD